MLKITVLIFTCFTVSITANSDPWGRQPTGMTVFATDTANIPLPQVANYRRLVKNAKGKEIEHIFRVCNGKNKKKCGYWENTNTKKRVASGKTTYDKSSKQLVIKNTKESDGGTYMTGNKKFKMNVDVIVIDWD